MKLLSSVLMSVALCGVAFAADSKVELKDQSDKASYSVGFRYGSSLKKQGFEAKTDLLIQGLKDGLSGGAGALTEAEMNEVFKALTVEMRTKAEEKRKVQGEKNKSEGEKFLAENKTKEGVKTTESGLQYKILKEGTGPKPTTNDTVMAHYRGTLIDGTEFDSSFKRGTNAATFPLNRVIKGWTEALSNMPVGSKWELYIPPQLGYGENGQGPVIGPNAVLIFEVELVGIKPATETMTPNQPVTSDIIKVPSAEELKKGAKIEVMKPGSTNFVPLEGDKNSPPAPKKP